MKILVLGGNGMLGHVMVRWLAEKGHDVTFSVRKTVPTWMPLSQKVGVVKFDAKRELPTLTGYDFVVNCIGAIKQKDLPDEDFYFLNAVFPWRLALGCKKVGAKLIHISSDCVFSGSLPPAQKHHPLAFKDAKDAYGKSKSMGEISDAVVVRTSIIGPADTADGLFEWFRQTPKASVPGFQNHIWSGVTTLCLSQFVENLITNPQINIPEDGGLIQLASAPISKNVLLKLIKDVFKVTTEVDDSLAGDAVNRALEPSVQIAADIHSQLVELRDWMERTK